MIRLIFSELWQRAGQWALTLLVATVGGLCFGIVQTSSASVAAYAAAGHPEVTGLAEAIGGSLFAAVLIAVAAVVGSTATMTLTAQRRAYALWKVLGIPERVIVGVITGQLAVTGALGGALGGLASPLAVPWYLTTFAELGLDLSAMPIVGAWWVVPMTGAAMAVAAVVGGRGPAVRAARTPEMQALRESGVAKARVGPVAWVIVGMLVFTVGVLVLLPVIDPGALADTPPGAIALSATQLLIAIALLLGPWTVRPLLYAWTALVPARFSVWFVARESCRVRSGQSLATVLPYAVATSLTGSFFGAAAAVGGRVTGFSTLFSLVFLICATGGVANIALVGRQRTADGALLGVLGASGRKIVGINALEGVVYAVTGTLFGLVCTAAAVLVTASIAGTSARDGFAGVPWPLLAGLFGVALLTTVGTTLLSGRRGDTLAALRQPA